MLSPAQSITNISSTFAPFVRRTPWQMWALIFQFIVSVIVLLSFGHYPHAHASVETMRTASIPGHAQRIADQPQAVAFDTDEHGDPNHPPVRSDAGAVHGD